MYPDEVVKEIIARAQVSARASHRRAVIAHGTHYVIGISAACAAGAAGYFSQLGDSASKWGTFCGTAGAILAGLVTFMNPLKRAAFHYAQTADYEALEFDAKHELENPSGAGLNGLKARLSQLRRRVSEDLQSNAPSAASDG